MLGFCLRLHRLIAVLLVSGCVSSGGNTSTFTLDWDAPLTRVDGSKLYPGEIDGYRIYYRQSGEPDFNVREIEDAGTTRWRPSGLPSGDYQFAVSTVATSGLESPRSETLRVTIP
ncbi:MAG: fibronectin type III domain-containing protein [Halospina sp.]